MRRPGKRRGGLLRDNERWRKPKGNKYAGESLSLVRSFRVPQGSRRAERGKVCLRRNQGRVSDMTASRRTILKVLGLSPVAAVPVPSAPRRSKQEWLAELEKCQIRESEPIHAAWQKQRRVTELLAQWVKEQS